VLSSWQIASVTNWAITLLLMIQIVHNLWPKLIKRQSSWWHYEWRVLLHKKKSKLHNNLREAVMVLQGREFISSFSQIDKA
jgi:hypothetical protein